MCEIWVNSLLPKALKSCPKSNKSPNLVTLLSGHIGWWSLVPMRNDVDDKGRHKVFDFSVNLLVGSFPPEEPVSTGFLS